MRDHLWRPRREWQRYFPRLARWRGRSGDRCRRWSRRLVRSSRCTRLPSLHRWSCYVLHRNCRARWSCLRRNNYWPTTGPRKLPSSSLSAGSCLRDSHRPGSIRELGRRIRAMTKPRAGSAKSLLVLTLAAAGGAKPKFAGRQGDQSRYHGEAGWPTLPPPGRCRPSVPAVPLVSPPRLLMSSLPFPHPCGVAPSTRTGGRSTVIVIPGRVRAHHPRRQSPGVIVDGRGPFLSAEALSSRCQVLSSPCQVPDRMRRSSMPWAAPRCSTRVAGSELDLCEPESGIEPLTCALRVRCSTG